MKKIFRIDNDDEFDLNVEIVPFSWRYAIFEEILASVLPSKCSFNVFWTFLLTVALQHAESQLNFQAEKAPSNFSLALFPESRVRVGLPPCCQFRDEISAISPGYKLALFCLGVICARLRLLARKRFSVYLSVRESYCLSKAEYFASHSIDSGCRTATFLLIHYLKKIDCIKASVFQQELCKWE